MMEQYGAEIEWQRGAQDFLDNRYSRRHWLRFDGGACWPASASPQVVPEPMADAAVADPEEMLVAALSSCHMLWFLSIAAKRGWVVDRYIDQPIGIMTPGTDGRMAITRITLRPLVDFGAQPAPDQAQLGALHAAAHRECFIAHSLTATVVCTPRLASGETLDAAWAP